MYLYDDILQQLFGIEAEYIKSHFKKIIISFADFLL